jgi:heme exporter protein A
VAPSIDTKGFLTLLLAETLAVFRGERLVFRDVGFAVPAGGALLLRGPNGAGKSSLLRAVAGLTPLAAGRLLWNGEDALDDLPTHAKRIAWLGHLDAVKLALSVGEHVADAVALAAVGLESFRDLPAKLLSAGQKRRLALARVIASKAPLWLLDEPTNGLDARSIAMLGEVFAGHLARGGMIIASTHTPLDLPEAGTLNL